MRLKLSEKQNLSWPALWSEVQGDKHLEILAKGCLSFADCTQLPAHLTHLTITAQSLTLTHQFFISCNNHPSLQVCKIKVQEAVDLQTLAKDLHPFPRLTVLQLKGWKLSAVPDFMASLSQLKELDLSDNLLSQLPASLSQLQQLKRLNLDHNRLTSMPSVLLQLKQLSHLSLDDNAFSEEEKAKLQKHFNIWF